MHVRARGAARGTCSRVVVTCSSGMLASLNGVRSLSMGLIILGHSITYMGVIGFVNEDALAPPTGAAATWSFQVFPSSEFAVGACYYRTRAYPPIRGLAHALLLYVRVQTRSCCWVAF